MWNLLSPYLCSYFLSIWSPIQIFYGERSSKSNIWRYYTQKLIPLELRFSTILKTFENHFSSYITLSRKKDCSFNTETSRSNLVLNLTFSNYLYKILPLYDSRCKFIKMFLNSPPPRDFSVDLVRKITFLHLFLLLWELSERSVLIKKNQLHNPF